MLGKKYFTFFADSSENLNVLNGQVSIFSSRKARPRVLKRYFKKVVICYVKNML